MAFVAIKERSRLQVRVTYSDDVETPVTPASGRYRIDCATTQTVIQDWADYVPAGPADILTVTPDQNAIINQGNAEEQKTLTVMSNPDTPVQFIESFNWLVLNLQGVP